MTTKNIEESGSSFSGPNVLQIEYSVPKRIMKSGFKWEPIYQGHADPLEESLRFFKETITNKEEV